MPCVEINAGKPIAEPIIQFGRLRKLGEIVKQFHGDYFFGLGLQLSDLISESFRVPFANQPFEDRQPTLRFLADLASKCQESNFSFTATYCRRIEGIISSQPHLTYEHVGGMLRELLGRLFDEMDGKLVWELDPSKSRYYTDPHPLGEDVAQCFPSLALEMQDAAKCYAVGQNTACVFHLMRVLEGSLNWTADQLGVSFERRNWENVIADIEKAIKSIDRRAPELQILSEAASHLRHIKDAWRNHVMHLRDRHDETSAWEIYSNVRAFMRNLAKWQGGRYGNG